jgi:hypothetical protein
MAKPNNHPKGRRTRNLPTLHLYEEELLHRVEFFVMASNSITNFTTCLTKHRKHHVSPASSRLPIEERLTDLEAFTHRLSLRRAGGVLGLHSITSSARASNCGGILRPSAFAVLRLITNSNLVGCSMGSSAGLAPNRILCTKMAARRIMSGMLAP